MVNEMVHLRLDSKMRKEIKDVLKIDSFSSESEFIRHSIRDKLEFYRKVKILHDLRGSVKPSKNHKKIPISDVFRAVGLED
jgi:Arc/MetJ-type ribon-helix-helix transcriptional regulator